MSHEREVSVTIKIEDNADQSIESGTTLLDNQNGLCTAGYSKSKADVEMNSCNSDVDLPLSDRRVTREGLSSSGTDVGKLPSSDADVQEYNPSTGNPDDKECPSGTGSANVDEEIASGPAIERDPKSKTCHLCNKVFARRSSLLKHMRNIHGGGSAAACSEIESSSASKPSKPSEGGSKSIVCHVCKKTYARRNALVLHHQTHHSELCTALCRLCPKRFHSNWALTGHINSVHKLQNFFQCKNCRKVCKNKEHFHFHKERCYRKSFWKPFKDVGLKLRKTAPSIPCDCKLCGEKFHSVYELREHGVALHKGKAFVCDVCGESFLLPDTLSCHINVHLEDKAFLYCVVSG